MHLDLLHDHCQDAGRALAGCGNPVEEQQNCCAGGGKRLVLCVHKQETGLQKRETSPEL